MPTDHLFYADTDLGRLFVAERDGALTQVLFRDAFGLAHAVCEETPLLHEALSQLREYLAGARQRFDLPLAPRGTDFQKAVWQALADIPYGETRSYGQIASAIGRPGAARAVGMANHVNPIGIIVPCHRVIGSSGQLTGYAGGLDIKRRLLDLERRHASKTGEPELFRTPGSAAVARAQR